MDSNEMMSMEEIIKMFDNLPTEKKIAFLNYLRNLPKKDEEKSGKNSE